MNQLNNNKAQGSALFTLVGGIIILLAVIFFIVKLATSGYYSDVDQSTKSATETRIMPVGSVTMGDGTAVGERTGEQIFNKICIQCHAENSAVPNVPKITHKELWGPRIAQGLDTLFNHASNGFNAMPPKGGAADLTDVELKRAIVYMANKSGGSFPEPTAAGAAPAATASGTAAAPAASGAAPSAAASATATATAGADGKKVFEGLCMACHSATAAIPFAPKITHNDQWAPRIKQGKDTLFKHAIEGFNGPDGGMMPAKGGNPSLSDDEVKAAVTYMVNQSGGKF